MGESGGDGALPPIWSLPATRRSLALVGEARAKHPALPVRGGLEKCLAIFEETFMSKTLFWDWLYRLFDSENGNSHAKVAKVKKGEDPFEAIHREFLWLKSGQIQEQSLKRRADSIWERNARLFFRQEFVNTLTEESI